jgi:hypothetical protein
VLGTVVTYSALIPNVCAVPYGDHARSAIGRDAAACRGGRATGLRFAPCWVVGLNMDDLVGGRQHRVHGESRPVVGGRRSGVLGSGARLGLRPGDDLPGTSPWNISASTTPCWKCGAVRKASSLRCRQAHPRMSRRQEPDAIRTAFAARGVRTIRMEYGGLAEPHEDELYLAVESIDHPDVLRGTRPAPSGLRAQSRRQAAPAPRCWSGRS